MPRFSANRPILKNDANSAPLQSSSYDMSFRGDYTGTNLIYKAYARPGVATSAPRWQIAKLAYDGSNNLTSITWPQRPDGSVSSDYEFIYDNRATYTYS
jgi:YD repeat-containing protein